MGSLPTVNEWEEDSYLSNHSPPLGNKNDLQQVKNVMTNMPVNHEEIGIANKLSPLLVTENSAKDQSLSVEDSTGKIKNAKEKEDTNLEISQNQSILRTPKKYLNRKKLRKLLIVSMHINDKLGNDLAAFYFTEAISIQNLLLFEMTTKIGVRNGRLEHKGQYIKEIRKFKTHRKICSCYE